MPDEFPTLEAVAVIGVLVALARTFALFSGLREIPALARALEQALRTGDLGRARSVCDRSPAAAAARFGHALVAGLESTEGASAPDRSVERALTRTRKSLRRGHARDLAATAVLIGAGAYATQASLGVGRLFYALLGAALALTVLGALLRQQTFGAIAATAGPLTQAAREGAGSTRGVA
jgi:hypothetical protein